ncbi:MAG: hypothetical protein IJ194_07170, partial [Bacilli bacterium]|nr:hypothetical protein [Bacilli bacterium]
QCIPFFARGVDIKKIQGFLPVICLHIRFLKKFFENINLMGCNSETWEKSRENFCSLEQKKAQI